MSYLMSFEGGDGVGKATQSKRLVENLKSIGKGAVLYSFPRYETDVGRAIRRHLVGETSFVVAKRQDSEHENSCMTHVGGACDCSPLVSSDSDLMFQCLMLADKYDAEPEIEKHIREGRFVVCDRWKDSSRAYGSADGLPIAWLERIHERLTSPSLTFLLTIPEEVAIARRPGLRDRYEKDRAKQAVVAERYREISKNGRWQVVDGTGTEEEVSEIIWRHVARKFGL